MRTRGLRRVLHLGEGSGRILAVVPLPPASANSGPDAMLLLGRREVCRELSLDWFARTHRLTPAETAVLKGLCASRSPKAIATDHGVCVSTVRTQIGSIRAKTGAESIRGVVAMVVQMPQLLGVLDTPAGPPAP
ncbi:hypothetical protein ABXN37_18700 [Piscinibacter sakaiensis]|uniref:helix-turn-helix transcriptional regulator n=1 Tax=Piscinibacter sakaiensis TaxID=1547922 RepID=UPI00372A1B61